MVGEETPFLSHSSCCLVVSLCKSSSPWTDFIDQATAIQTHCKYGAVEWEPGDRLYHLMTWWFVLVLLELSSSHQGYSGSNLEGAGGVDMGTWY